MEPQRSIDLQGRILQLERRLRYLQVAFALGALALVVAACASFGGRPPEGDASMAEILRVRGLVVVDDNGVEQLRLGAPLPDPIVQGERRPRKAPVSGMLIYDADGDERGGFVTSDQGGEAFIGLDSKEGQVVLLLANQHDGGNLQIWDHNDNRVAMWAVNGAPHFIMVEHGETIFSLPRDGN